MKKISFGRFLSVWCCAALLLLLLNGFILKNSVVHSIILSSLGLILLVYPIYPVSLENNHDAKKCRLITRIIAVIEILGSFLVHTTF